VVTGTSTNPQTEKRSGCVTISPSATGCARQAAEATAITRRTHADGSAYEDVGQVIAAAAPAMARDDGPRNHAETGRDEASGIISPSES